MVLCSTNIVYCQAKTPSFQALAVRTIVIALKLCHDICGVRLDSGICRLCYLWESLIIEFQSLLKTV